jgi:hypothetical protein
MTPETAFTAFPQPDVSAIAVVGPASDQAAGDPGPASPPAATEIEARNDEPAAASTPAAGDLPAASPEARLFSIVPGRVALHDGELYVPGDMIVLTRAEHTPLFFMDGVVAEPWNA